MKLRLMLAEAAHATVAAGPGSPHPPAPASPPAQGAASASASERGVQPLRQVATVPLNRHGLRTQAQGARV
jgi:hypothetical protein